jgi:XrtJ-associated TM-motif-TM protein
MTSACPFTKRFQATIQKAHYNTEHPPGRNNFMRLSIHSSVLFTVIALALICPAALHAQTGCTDSPEAPTDVLMLVGAVGMTFGSSLVTKMLRKCRSK